MLKNSNNFVLYYRELGHLLKPKNDLCEQAQKAMYGVIRKIRHFNLLGNCQFDLFDKAVSSVLLYGCEIGDFENLDIKRVHLKFLKTVLNVRSTTPNMMYGKTGCYPLYIIVFTT